MMKNKGIEIIWLKKKFDLGEIYSTGLEYCFLGEKWEQCCAWVHCKDFLQDALTAFYNKKNIECFGFTYGTDNPKPYLERIRLALANQSDKKFAEKIPNVLDFLHQVETDLHLIRTSTHVVANPLKRYSSGRICIFEGSSRWMVSPPMLSLYSLLLRAGFCHKKEQSYKDTIKQIVEGEIKPYQKEDASQLKGAQSGIDRIMQYGYAKIFYNDPKKNYPDKNIYDMHDRSGICAFSSGESKHINKHWHRKMKPIKETNAV